MRRRRSVKGDVPQGVTPSVVLVNPKYPHNVGAALRVCSCFDAAVEMPAWSNAE
jgi:hypothetical protein